MKELQESFFVADDPVTVSLLKANCGSSRTGLPLIQAKDDPAAGSCSTECEVSARLSKKRYRGDSTEWLRGRYASMMAYVAGFVARIMMASVKPPSEQLRLVYLANRESDYRISLDTGVHRDTLRRLREGRPISMRAFDRLAQYWGLELVKQKTRSV